MENITVANYKDDKYYPRIVLAVERLLEAKNYVAPIEVFVAMGLLEERDVSEWRNGKMPFLERSIRCNLSKANRILKILRFHAHDLNLGSSLTTYKRGQKLLRFSKNGRKASEEAYSRHFVKIGKKKSNSSTA